MASTHAQKFKPKLYVLRGSLFPRRVTVYLEEKGISSEFDIIPVSISQAGVLDPIPGTSATTVPILDIGNGRFITQSIAILEYMEDMYPQTPHMRGKTPEAAARVRELMDVAVEACTVFSMYVHKSSKLFESLEEQNKEAAKLSLHRLHFLLDQLERMADLKGPFLSDESGQPMLVDCVMLSTLQFAHSVYDVDLTDRHPRLKIFLEAFQKRKSSELEGEFPQAIIQVAKVMSVR